MITELQALTIAKQAIEYYQTGQPTTFNLQEVKEAWHLLANLSPKLKGTPKGKLLLNGVVYYLSGLYFRLGGYRSRAKKANPKRLATAAANVAKLLDLAQQEEDTYWQRFTNEAISQAESVIEQAQVGGKR